MCSSSSVCPSSNSAIETVELARMRERAREMLERIETLPFEQLCPGNAELQKMQQRFR